ncbi:carboxypeptidase regulatory-like domain-containing protein, partial [Candidatus Sumerlaeota bacterium]
DTHSGKDDEIICCMAAGEWLAYRIRAPRADRYDIDLRVDGRSSERTVRFELDGKPVGGICQLPKSAPEGGGPQTDTVAIVRLSSGVQTLKIVFEKGGALLDWLQFVPQAGDWRSSATKSLAVRALWEKDGSPAAGTTVTLRGRLLNGRRWASDGATAGDGRLALPFPETSGTALLTAMHKLAEEPIRRQHSLDVDEPLTLKLKHITAVYGRVFYLANGQAVAGARVELLESDARRAAPATTSSATGLFELRGFTDKKIRLVAIKGELCSFVSEKDIETISIIEQERNGPYDLMLRPGPLLTGVVRDQVTGEPIPKAKVEARRDGNSGGSGRSKTHTAIADDEGRYRLVGLYASRYRLTASAKTYVPGSLVCSLGPDRRGKRDLKLEPGSTVDVYVVDEQDQPVEKARVYAQDSSSGSSTRKTTGADGHALVDGISRKNPPKFYAYDQEGGHSEQQSPTFVKDKEVGSVKLTLIARKEQQNDQEQEEEEPKGVFIGRVTNKAGQALEGATVTWGRPSSLQRSKEKTTTDAAGNYSLEVTISERAQLLAAQYAGCAPAWEEQLEPGTADEPREVNFTLETGHWLDVTVLDEDKRPLSGIRVYLYGKQDNAMRHYQFPGQTNSQETNEKGFVRFDDLYYQSVQVQVSGGNRTPASRETGVDKEIVFILKPTGIIRGRLLDKERNQPITDFKVRVSGNNVSSERGRQGEAFADSQGAFVLTDLYLGSDYRLIFSAEGYIDSKEHKVKSAREAKAEEETYYLSQGADTIVELLDAAGGLPLGNAAIVTARLRSDRSSHISINWHELNESYNSYYTSFQSITTDDAGRLTVAETEEQQCTLFIVIEGYARLLVRPDDRSRYLGDDGIIRIGLARQATLSGTYSLDGIPVSGVEIRLSLSANNRNEDFGRQRTDAEGRYRFSSLTAGSYSMRIRRRLDDGSSVSMNRKVTLRAGEDKIVDLVSDMGPYELYGTITDNGQPLANVSVGLSHNFDWEYGNFSLRTDADGRYRISGLREGKYRLSLSWQNPRNNKDSRRVNEEIELQADTEKNFELSANHVVTARLVFPPDTPEETRLRYHQAYLRLSGQTQDGNPDNLDHSKSANVAEGRLEFRGRFKGKYRLSVYCRKLPGSSSSTSRRLPGEFEIDNLTQDVDLGDIAVPLIGSVKVKFVFARPENRANYKSAQLQTTQRNYSSADNPESIAYYGHAQLDGNGVAVFAGRFKGDYKLTLISSGEGGQSNVQIPEVFQISDPSADNDMGEVRVPAVYAVRGRVVFTNPALQDTAMQLSVSFLNRENTDPQVNPESLTPNGSATIDEEGRFVLLGRFLGGYSFHLSSKDDRSGSGRLPETYELNNLAGDQDLGELAISGYGNVLIRFKKTDPDKAPRYLRVSDRYQRADGGSSGRSFSINGEKEEYTLSLLPEGAHTLRFSAQGFRLEPAETVVTVSGTQTPTVELTITPDSTVTGDHPQTGHDHIVNF